MKNAIFYTLSTLAIAAGAGSVYFGSQPVENNTTVTGVVNKITKKKQRVAKKKITTVYKTDFRLVKAHSPLRLTAKERHCMAKNAFHEAGVEGVMGMVAVLQVSKARLKTERWGKSFCSVIYAKAQFSWTLSKSLKNEKPKGELWALAHEAVKKFESGYRVEGLGDALFYHTDYIAEPKWASPNYAVGKIGKHIFYKKAATAEEQRTSI